MKAINSCRPIYQSNGPNYTKEELFLQTSVYFCFRWSCEPVGKVLFERTSPNGIIQKVNGKFIDLCTFSIFSARIYAERTPMQKTVWNVNLVFHEYIWYCRMHSQLFAHSYVGVPNILIISCPIVFFYSARLPPRRPEFDSWPGYVSPRTSSLGWRWPWSSSSILYVEA